MKGPQYPRSQESALDGIEVLGPMAAGYDEILTEGALWFVRELERRFRRQRDFLLMLREETRGRIAQGARPNFLAETRPVRDAKWTVDPVPDELVDRRVEVVGPVGENDLEAGLRSGANSYVADFEDATPPTWHNLIESQLHLRAAIRATGCHEGTRTALFVRPRGWHLLEEHVQVDGAPASASLCDFGLHLWHNALSLLARGTAPYFYLPKIESHLEARLWNSVICWGEERLGLARGTIKATVVVESILAAFQMDEILYQLREHSAGLRFGRRNYLFSFMKEFESSRAHVLPDADLLTADQPFLRACQDLLIATCHRRGTHAIGGLASVMPDDRAGLATMCTEKRTEADAGFDGTWVAHPALVAAAKAEFDAAMATPNQVDRHRFAAVRGLELLNVPRGPRSKASLRASVRLVLRFLCAWLGGRGRIASGGQIVDLATIEVLRTQVWQWCRHAVALNTGERVSRRMVRRIVREEEALSGSGEGSEVGALVEDLMTAREIEDFLPIRACPCRLDLPEGSAH